MTRWIGVRAAAALAIATIAAQPVHADTVQLALRDGRVSLQATNASAAEIFEAWGRAGGVSILNADRLASTPLTLTLNDVSEEQALDVLLRSVGGYLARRRPSRAPEQSVFDRIVILPTPAGTRAQPAASAPGAGPTPFPAPPRPLANGSQGADEPDGIPQGPGVMRLVGADGQPVEDDQAGAPPPPLSSPPADGGTPRVPAPPPPRSAAPLPAPDRAGTPTTSGAAPAPIGSSAPGMPVPDPNGAPAPGGNPTAPGRR
ncbi:MAG: hypothetical protein AB7Q29_03950 [Vicinamibacterales bacterium]